MVMIFGDGFFKIEISKIKFFRITTFYQNQEIVTLAMPYLQQYIQHAVTIFSIAKIAIGNTP